MRDMLVLSKWFNGLETASEKELREIGYRIVKLVLEQEIDTSNDVYPLSKIWKDIESDALGTYTSYMEKKKYGEEHGRRQSNESIEVWKYCQSHPGAKATEVGEYLESIGYSIKSASKKGPWSKIYDLPGWKERNNSNFLNSEKSSDSDSDSEKVSENSVRNSDGFFEF